MSQHRLTIVPNADGPGSHQLHLDGRDVSRGVRSVNLALNPGERPRVDLEMAHIEVERLDFETAHVHISEATRETLVALGWTAPPSDEPPAVVLPAKPGIESVIYMGGQALKIVGLDRPLDLTAGVATISLHVVPAAEADA